MREACAPMRARDAVVWRARAESQQESSWFGQKAQECARLSHLSESCCYHRQLGRTRDPQTSPIIGAALDVHRQQPVCSRTPSWSLPPQNRYLIHDIPVVKFLTVLERAMAGPVGVG